MDRSREIAILKHAGGYLRSMVDMRGLIYWQIAGLHKTYDVIEANKDSQVITLAGTAGINPGDILLINQLNDNDLVDPVGVEGKCTYCGYEAGDRVLGQLVEVAAVNGNQVTLNLPLLCNMGPGDTRPRPARFAVPQWTAGMVVPGDALAPDRPGCSRLYE